MTDLQKALDHLTDQIKTYRETSSMDGDALSEILKQITATLFYLEKERASFHHTYQSSVCALVSEGMSVSRAEAQTHSELPEMYLLRRIMDSAYEVVGAIRTNISWIKTGLTNV